MKMTSYEPPPLSLYNSLVGVGVGVERTSFAGDDDLWALLWTVAAVAVAKRRLYEQHTENELKTNIIQIIKKITTLHSIKKQEQIVATSFYIVIRSCVRKSFVWVIVWLGWCVMSFAVSYAARMSRGRRHRHRSQDTEPADRQLYDHNIKPTLYGRDSYYIG